MTNLAVSSVTTNSVSLLWTAPGDDGNRGTATSYDVRFSSAPITESNWASAARASATPAPAAAGTPQRLTLAGLIPGSTYYFALKTSDETNNLSALSNVPRATTLTMVTPPTGSIMTILIASNSVWKYLDDGSNQSNAWSTLTFDDSTWASGPAQLGYGGGKEATPVSFGPDSAHKFITTYFRRHFTVGDPSLITSVLVSVQRDDGAVAYLNAQEIFRSNMPTGAVNYLSLAPISVSGTDKTSFHDSPPIDPGYLRSGDNLMAVEIHQHSGGSSAMDFNLQLFATNRIAPPLVSIAVNSSNQVSLRWNAFAGKIYRVQYASGPATNVWTSLGSDVTATNSTAAATDSLGGVRQRFYRVLLTN